MTAPRSLVPRSLVPRALLTLYGALDQTVLQSDDPGDAATVDQYLPNASANRGWSRQIETFFFGEDTRSTDIAGNVGGALREILDNPQQITIPELSRLVFVTGALTHFATADAREQNRRPITEALALAGRADKTLEHRRSDADSFFELLATTFTRRQDWDEVIQAAFANGWLMPEIRDIPLCNAAIVPVGDLPCVVIDAVIASSNITLNNLKNVVDALNWPRDYSHFFCDMVDKNLRGDGWRNVLEYAGFCDIAPDRLLKTGLKYIKSEHGMTDARLDYDLSEDDLGGDGRVLVDRGYINMRCTRQDNDPSQGGVRVRTRKVAHVKGLDPYAQAAFICISGYAYAAVEMLFGPAIDPPTFDFVPWRNEPLKAAAAVEADAAASAAGAASGVPAGNPPPDSKLDAATKVAKSLKESAKFITDKHLELSEKWLGGQLTFAELAKQGQEIGGRLASDPWKLLHELAKPPDTDPSGTSKSGSP